MSKETDKMAVLEAIEGLRPSATGWVVAYCPFCMSDSKKLSVNVGKGKYAGYFQCWKPSCGKRGFIETAERNEKVKRERSEVLPEMPPQFELLTKKSGGRDQIRLAKFRKYLYGRGVTQRIINEAHIGCCVSGKYAGNVVFPIMHEEKAVGFVARTIYGKTYRYPPNFEREFYPFNQDVLLEDTDIPAIIVEGPFDAIVHWPFAVACLGQPVDTHWQIFKKAKRPLVLAFDADEGAKSEFMAMRLQLEGVACKWLKIPPGMDPGGADRGKFLRRAFSLFGVGELAA